MALLLLSLAAAALAQDLVHLPAYHFVPRPFNWMNDPNGPFYDPVHQLHHLMYQYRTPRVWGHAVSSDLLHWTQLPVALENDKWYDQGGVFTGSTTLVNGTEPVISYAVSTNDMQCLAMPADRSDPNLTVWTKYSGNPVISVKTGAMPGRDPTTAWWSPSRAAWLMAYGTTAGANVYASKDFLAWTHVGNLNPVDTSGQWECPDFYESNIKGVWVLKASTDGTDYWATATFDDVTATVNYLSSGIPTATQRYDYGAWYASKSYFDAGLGQQVLWGWVLEERRVNADGSPYGWASIQSLPRKVTVSADTKNLLTYPIDAVTTLRIPSSHASFTNLIVPPGAVMPLAGVSGTQIEIVATLNVSASSGGCGFRVLSTGTGTGAGQEYTSVGITSYTQEYMPGIDLPGDDFNVTNINYHDPHICQSVCLGSPQCVAWTYVVRPPLVGACCLKSTIPAQNPNPTCTSGVKNGGTEPSAALFGDTTFSSLNTQDGHAANRVVTPVFPQLLGLTELRVFVDKSVVEAFGALGRVAVTRRAYPTLATAVNVEVFSEGGSCSFVSIDTYNLNAA